MHIKISSPFSKFYYLTVTTYVGRGNLVLIQTPKFPLFFKAYNNAYKFSFKVENKMAVRQTTTKNMNITTLYNMHTPITHKIG